jgi:hypothetical protein
MNPNIGKVQISVPKPEVFIAEMASDIEVYELYEGLEKGAQRLARALLGGTRTGDKRCATDFIRALAPARNAICRCARSVFKNYELH